MSANLRPGPNEFNENSPRPPVPGEETEVVVSAHPASSKGTWSVLQKLRGRDSPVLTPRRSSLAAGSLQGTVADRGAPLGFEPEGSCGSGGGDSMRYPHEQPCMGPHSPLPCFRWARSLEHLLDDSDGVILFSKFLDQEDKSHADMLNFWFACEGLKKQEDPKMIPRIVKAIHRKYFKNTSTQLAIPNLFKEDVNRRIRENKEIVDVKVFDSVQRAVEDVISRSTYPNFLESKLYLDHVKLTQGGPIGESTPSSGSGSSSSSGRGEILGLGAGSLLPTLDENKELSMSASHGQPAMAVSVPSGAGHGSAPPRLTRDLLMATERRRATELKPKPEAYAGLYMQRPYHRAFSHPNNPHMVYNSYNPVSRQDSELQSLSSDARTESDNMSLTDSSIDGMSSIGRSRSSRRQHLRHCKQMKESASLNRDPYMHRTVIPRTQLVQKETLSQKPQEFAAILIEKLDSLKRNQEAQEKLDRKLQEIDVGEESSGMEGASGDAAVSSQALADALREKLLTEDDSDQAILDQHVSRVWSDLTPSRSPGFDSPRPKSPEARRRVPTAQSTLLPPPKGPYQSRQSYTRHIRKEKDVFSTFSSDSGNVHDYVDQAEHKHYMSKSKSVPDYVETLKQDPYGAHDPRFRQGRETCRRSASSRKTLTDQTDSGVSVVSDTPPVQPQTKENSKVLSWLMESEKQHTSSGDGSWHARSERDSTTSSKHRTRATSATSPITSRHSRKSGLGHISGSRSGSLERGVSVGVSMSGTVGPAQPFVADPSMPPLPQPHTATQLEEARRRLMDETHSRQRPRYSMGVKDASHSNPSTLRRSTRPSRPVDQNSQEFTTVVFTFCEEQFPYRVKIPGRSVSLKQFKEYLPKKGNYRYFFKTECEELDVKVIQEEITDDNDTVPLWEGKVMAQVKPVE